MCIYTLLIYLRKYWIVPNKFQSDWNALQSNWNVSITVPTSNQMGRFWLTGQGRQCVSQGVWHHYGLGHQFWDWATHSLDGSFHLRFANPSSLAKLSPCILPRTLLVWVGSCVVSCFLCYKCTPPQEDPMTGALLKGIKRVYIFKGHWYRGKLQLAH